VLDETIGSKYYSSDPYTSSGPGPGVPSNTNPASAPSMPSGPSNPYYVPPNYADIIANSPYVQAAHAMAAQQMAALQAQLGSGASRALINLGDIGLANQVGDLNLPDNTASLVKAGNEAGTSVLAQLGYRHGQNVESIPAALAGRGFYRSGETGYSLGQEDKGYGQQQYDARSKTLDYLNGLYQNYLNAQFGIQQQELSAEFAAYQSALSQIPSMIQPVSAPAPTGPAPSSAAVTTTPDGGLSGYNSIFADPNFTFTAS